MLQDVLDLMRRAEGNAISAQVVAAKLGLAPDVTRHMLRMLVQRGRLVQVETGCASCEVCPLHRFCAGASGPAKGAEIDREAGRGYRIP